MKKKKRFVASDMLDFDKKTSKVTIVDGDGKIQEKLAIRIPEFFDKYFFPQNEENLSLIRKRIEKLI